MVSRKLGVLTVRLKTNSIRNTFKRTLRNGMRQGCGDELSSRCNLVVNSSGSTLASTKPCINIRTLDATDSGCSLARRSKVDKKFLHLTLAVSGVICKYNSLLNLLALQQRQPIPVQNFRRHLHYRYSWSWLGPMRRVLRWALMFAERRQLY